MASASVLQADTGNDEGDDRSGVADPVQPLNRVMPGGAGSRNRSDSGPEARVLGVMA
jgi:hypothetical protein